MGNLAGLFLQGRPMLLSNHVPASLQQVASGAKTLVNLSGANLNNWGVQIMASPIQPYYAVPLAGWYLCEGNVVFAPSSSVSNPSLYIYLTGFEAVQNGTSIQSETGRVTSCTNYARYTGSAGAELFQVSPSTSDTLAMWGYQNTPYDAGIAELQFKVEWVGLPTSGLTDYDGPYGTVVSSPVAAASFPSGPGTTLDGAVSAGATSITVYDATGMVTGGTLGLDWMNGEPCQDYAETVTITSVSSTTIGVTETSYAHATGAPVAVPVSAAFLNQQCRDAINFLAYPPLCRAEQTTVQSISSGTTTLINSMSASTDGCVDNFSGFGSDVYTAPVAGVYFCYGQVMLAGSESAFAYSATLEVNASTVYYGCSSYADTTSAVQVVTSTVRQLLRLDAGDTVGLYVYQNEGSAMDTYVSLPGLSSRLIVVFRGF